MERLSARKRGAIVGDYLSALPYSEIAAKHHVSTGAVANVVAELKAGQFPAVGDAAEHIDLLRELSIDLKKANLTAGESAVGLAVLSRINECGLDPADIYRWPLILKSAATEGEAKGFVELVYGIQEVQKKTGLSLEDLHNKVHELEQKAAELEPLSKRLDDSRKQLAAVTQDRKKLIGEIAGLEQKYTLLNPRVKDLEKREQELSLRVKELETRSVKAEAALATLAKEKQRLLEIGFSIEALAEFSQRVQAVAQRRHIKPVELSDRLLHDLENLGKGVGLEALVQRRQTELKEQEQALTACKRESRSLAAVVESLKQQKLDIEASIKETREKVGVEMDKVTAAAQDMVNTVTGELRRGHDDTLAEVRRLKDEALEVGKEVGKYEGIVQANQWLGELLSLAQGDEKLDPNRVRTIALLMLRGTAAWVKHNKGGDMRLSTMLRDLEDLMKEVEQWEPSYPTTKPSIIYSIR